MSLKMFQTLVWAYTLFAGRCPSKTVDYAIGASGNGQLSCHRRNCVAIWRWWHVITTFERSGDCHPTF